MIELAAIDRFAGQISSSQRGFILSLDGLFHRLKTKNGSAVGEFKRESYEVMSVHLEDLRRLVNGTLPVIAFLAGEEDQHMAPATYLLDTLSLNSAQSISMFLNVLRRIHFDRQLGQSAVSRGVVVKQKDKMGRRGDPERYAYLSARKAALDTFNDTKYMSNKKGGIDSRVRYENESHKFHGLLVTQYSQDDSISYEVAREKIFHPQSQAVLD